MILMLLSIVPLSVIAETATSGTTGDCTWTLEGSKLTISGNGKTADYFYSTHPWPNTITEVVIEEGVTTLDEYGFYGCENIENFTIPKSLKRIEYSAFKGCNIEKLHITDLKTWFDMSTYTILFESVKYLCCDGEIIRDVVIPKELKEVRASVFANYKELKSVTFTTLPIKVGQYAFKGCENIEDVYINNLSNWIKSNFIGADYDYDWIDHEFYIYECESNPLIYAENLYLNGELVKGEVKIPDGITEIGESVFYGYDKLEKIIISDSVKRVGRAAFCSCENLKEVKFGKNVTAIGPMAFSDCSSLKTIALNNKMDAIGHLSFSNCTSLTDVYFDGVKDEADEFRYQRASGSDLDKTLKYFKKAKWHYNKNKTLAKINTGWKKYTWYLYENGVLSKKTTLVKYKGKWFYVYKGVWNDDNNTTFKYNGKVFCIKNGKWKKNYKGLAYYNDCLYYFKNGKLDKTKNGFVSYLGGKYLVKNGKVVKDKLSEYKGTYYFLNNGRKTDITSIRRIDGKWYYIKNGKWSKEKAIVRYVPQKVKIKKGVYIYSYYLTGYKGELFYVNNGYAQLDFSGKVNVKGKIYTIKDGIVV